MDADYGYANGNVEYDAIEEVEIAIGGHKAEVGRTSAGFINVVTKSGGNSFSGVLTVGAGPKALGQVVVPQDQITAYGLLQPQVKKYQYDVGLGFGGPIIKDKVWFFVAPRFNTFEQSTYLIPFTDPDGVFHPAYPNIKKEYFGLAKITIQLAKNLKWFGMAQWNRWKETPEMWAVTKVYSPKETQKYYDDSSSPTASSVLTYVLNQNAFVEARFGLVNRRMYLPFSNAWEGPVNRGWHTDLTTLQEWGGPNRPIYDYQRSEWNPGLAFTLFQDRFLGCDHEFKAGAEYAYAISDRLGMWPNPYSYYWNKGQPWYFSDSVPYKGQVKIWSGSTANLRSFKDGQWRIGFFLQDSLNIGKRLTANVGLRYDEYHGFVPARHWEGWNDVWENGLANVLLPQIFLPAGATLDSPQIDDVIVYKSLSPRIGLSYDLFGGGKTIVRGSFARYGEPLFTTAVDRVIPIQETSVTFQWFDDNHSGKLDLPPIDRYIPGSYAPYITDTTALRNQLAPDFKAPYTDEMTLGIVQQIGADINVSLNYMNKFTQHMPGSLNLNLPKNSQWWIPYTVTDPGDDGKHPQQLTVYGLRSDAPLNLIQISNIDDAWRKYWGFNLLLNKRMSKGWMFSGSIAVSKAYGNFPNGYLAFTGSQNYWDPNSDVNRGGRLEFDRPVIIKLMSTIEMPLGINISPYFRYYSGGHYTRQVTVYFPTSLQGGYTPRSASVTVNAEANNSRDFMPDTELDFRLEKTFRFGKSEFSLWADVYNVFGYWYFQYAQSELVGGYIYANGSFARYPRYGLADAIYGTRQINLGARIKF